MILKNYVQISAIRQQLKPIFIFSIISLWELLSCHSKLSTYATAIKNNIFVEAMDFLQSFSFVPHIPSEELIFLYFSQIDPFVCHDNQSNLEVGQKVYVW